MGRRICRTTRRGWTSSLQSRVSGPTTQRAKSFLHLRPRPSPPGPHGCERVTRWGHLPKDQSQQWGCMLPSPSAPRASPRPVGQRICGTTRRGSSSSLRSRVSGPTSQRARSSLYLRPRLSAVPGPHDYEQVTVRGPSGCCRSGRVGRTVLPAMVAQFAFPCGSA